MSKALFRRTILVAALAVATLTLAHAAENNDEVLQRIATEQANYRQALREQLQRTRVLEATPPSGFVATVLGDSNPDYQRYRRNLEQHHAALAETESSFRQSIVAEIVAHSAHLSEADRLAYIQSRQSEAKAAYDQRVQSLRNTLAQGLRSVSSAEDRARKTVEIEGLLRTARLEYEMTAAAVRQSAPTTNVWDEARGGEVSISSTTARMRALMHEATSIDTEIGRGEIRDDATREAERWMREYRRDAAIDEYRRLARSGPILDASTGRPIAGTTRQEIARDSERALAEELRKRSLQPSRYDVLRFLASTDARTTTAEGIDAAIAASPEYRALDFLNPAQADDSSAHFRALAHAVRLQETEVDKWRTDFVPSSKFTTGAATAHRIAGNAGEMSLSQVDGRIARYHREAETVVQAFNAAATMPPGQLTAPQRELLRAYGYIAGEPGRERYTVPTEQQLAGLKGNLNLPGAHVLDTISAANATKAVVAAVAPQMAGGQMAYLLRGLGAGERTAAAGATVADMIAGLGTDAAFEYAETGKVTDFGRKVIDATLMRAGGSLVGAASNATAGRLASVFKNKELREQAEGYLAQTLGLASESALQSYYQGQVQGTGMTYDSFLSGLMTGAISRAASSAYDNFDTTTPTPDWINKRVPEWLRPAVAADPELGREMFDRQKAIAARQSDAEKKFRAIVGDDVAAGRMPPPDSPAGLDGTSSFAHDGVTREQLANRLTHALESGQITWAELKALYAQRPDLEPVMATINERRTKIFGGMVNQAQELARSDLQAEHAAREARLRENLGHDPRQLGEAIFRNNKWYADELANINERPAIPGSTNLTSDIDRSVRSEFVRKHLKELYGRRTAGYDTPATSAQAWDVNEYINVMPAMGKILGAGANLAKLPAGREYLGLEHAQAVEANGMASAMLHMTPAQRDQYRANLLRQAGGDDAARQLLQRQLNVADMSLARADKELTDEMARLKAENPNLANATDLATRARDNLYARRTEGIRDKTARVEVIEQQLRGLDAASPEAQRLEQTRNELLGELQRDWGVALREGIETYASLENLDVVLGDAQFPDVKVRQLINDPNYTRDGLNANGRSIGEGEVRNMLNDQVMMMTHHMNGYHEGKEGVIDAASALGKYAERGVLAMKLQGADLTREPMKTLNEVSERLVKARKDPAALRRELESLGNGDADAGLEALSRMIMGAIPGTAGLFDPAMVAAHGTTDGSADLHDLRGDVARRRAVVEEAERTATLEGPHTARAENAAALHAIDAELGALRAEQSRRTRLGERYVRQDWPKVEALETEAARIDTRMAALSALGRTNSTEYRALQRRRGEIDQALAGYAESFTRAGGKSNAKPTPDDIRLANRIAGLEEEKQLREEADTALAAAAKEEDTRLATAKPFADGVTPFAANDPLPAKPGSILRATLLGGEATIPVE